MIKRRNPMPEGSAFQPSVAKPVDSPWLILQERIASAEKVMAWSKDSESEYIRVPLFDYMTKTVDPSVLLQLGVQVGALTAHLVIGQKEAARLFIATGNIFQRPDGKERFQCWLGFALELKG